MIRVLVAEDERPISRSIVRAIEATDSDFEVKYAAYNGIQTKEYLDKEKIDVIFLDVNMPAYDGLWILDYIQNTGKNIISVILTGYQEFEYAQRALRSKAFDYLLKPLDQKTLTDLLKRIKLEIWRMKRIDILQESRIVKHNVFENRECLTDVSYFAVCFLGGASKGILSDETVCRQLKTQLEMENYLQTILNQNEFWLTRGQEESERLLFIRAGIEDYETILNRIVNSCNELPITIASYGKTVQLFEVKETQKKLSMLAKNSMMLDEGMVIWYSQKEKNDEWKEKKKLSEVLTKIQENCTEEQLMEILNKITDITSKRRVALEYGIKRFFVRLCEKVPTQVNYIDLEEEILATLENGFDYDGLIEQIRKILKAYFFIQTDTTENRGELALKICRYLERNFRFAFSSQILEDKFGYSSFYLRTIFKNEYGMSPGDYLLKIRMEKAVTLLKQNLKVKLVAEEVGFSDPLYFSKVFKKYMGIGPREYIQSFQHSVE